MKSIILNSIIIILFSVLFFSCNKENHCDTVTMNYASEEMKMQVIEPLTGIDTLKFLYNNKDTQIYVGEGVKSDWQYVPGGDPTICDKKYEYLIYNYNCINVPNYSFKVEYYQYGVLNANKTASIYFNLSFKNVDVGQYLIPAKPNDSIEINKHWYKEPHYISNGPDTMQYFMLSGRQKNPDVLFLKIKYLNNELTLIK